MGPSDGSSDAAFDLSDVYIPIVLGVTGHREIADHDEAKLRLLENAVEEIFHEFRRRHPSPTPLRLLSSLAPGADQLVARVAERCSAAVEIVAPLPFPWEVYAHSSTFTDYDEERASFLKWLERIESFVVPYGSELSDPADFDRWNEFANTRSRRHECYANVGAYVARHCHALIAIWDGHRSEKESGTAEIIECKLEGRLPRKYPHPKALQMGGDEGPVYTIHWPRENEEAANILKPPAVKVQVPCSTQALKGRCEVSQHERDCRSTRWRRLYRRFLQIIPIARLHPNPTIAEWRRFEGGCQAIQDFNEDISRRSRDVDSAIQQRVAERNRSDFWQEVVCSHKAIRRLSNLRESAAALAADLDHRFKRDQLSVFVLLFFAALSLDLRPELEALYGERPSVGVLLLLSFLLSFVGFIIPAGLIVLRGFYGRLYERRLDYRAFGEALRVRLMWAAAGIGESVAANYLGQMRGEVTWARRALLAMAPPPSVWPRLFENLTANYARFERLKRIKDEWVTGQKDFYQETSEFHRRHAAWLGRIGFGGAVLGFLAALVALGLVHDELARLMQSPLFNYLLIGYAVAILLVAYKLFVRSDNDRKWVIVLGISSAVVVTTGLFAVIGGVVLRDVVHGASPPSRIMESPVASIVLISCAVLIVAAGLVLTYRERISCKELANLYERMLTIFEKGTQELEDLFEQAKIESASVVTEIEEIIVSSEGAERLTAVFSQSNPEGVAVVTRIQEVFIALGREAITENAQWLILRRGQRLELRPA